MQYEDWKSMHDLPAAKSRSLAAPHLIFDRRVEIREINILVGVNEEVAFYS